MAQWFEDDALWEAVAPTLFPAERLRAASTEVEHALTLLAPPVGAKLLDLCCGVGRHSLELARRGFVVTGVDRTRRYLEIARERAAAEGISVELVHSDMREFVRPGQFDGAINLFTSFGYFEDPADDLRTARNLYESIKPGGRLVLDTMGKEILARIFRERDWRVNQDGSIILEERRVRSGWDWIENRWILIQGSERREFRVANRLYGGTDLRSLLKEAGFNTVELYGSLAATPYDHKAERLVAVAQK
jgi:SAM-dependent methyltransferase